MVLVMKKEVEKKKNVVENEDNGKYSKLLVRNLKS
jgi:hypothetical protein